MLSLSHGNFVIGTHAMWKHPPQTRTGVPASSYLFSFQKLQLLSPKTGDLFCFRHVELHVPVFCVHLIFLIGHQCVRYTYIANIWLPNGFSMGCYTHQPNFICMHINCGKSLMKVIYHKKRQTEDHHWKEAQPNESIKGKKRLEETHQPMENGKTLSYIHKYI